MSRSGLYAFSQKYGTSPRAATRVGDWGDFASGALSGVFAAVHAGVASDQQEDQQQKSAADASAALATSVAADYTATQAGAQARWSAQMKRPSATTDAATAATASAAQDAAAARLSPDQAPARVAAARKVLDEAAAKLRAMKKGQPGEIFAKCAVDAAQATFDKASGQQITRQVPDGAPGASGAKQQDNRRAPTGARTNQGPRSFWTDLLVGPVPGWGVAAGGVGVGAILWRVLRGRWGL